MQKISIVIPCYRSEKTIEFVCSEIVETIAKRSEAEYEIILVNDCSPDGVYEVIKRITDKDEKVKGINFSKNYGKASAVLAGLSVVSGDVVIIMDDDGQCPGNKIWELVDALGNADIAYADYPVKTESGFKRFGSKLYKSLLDYLIEQPEEIRASNMVAMKRYIAEEMIRYKNPFPALHPLMMQISHSVTMVPMEERDRNDDKGGGFSFFKSVKLSINGWTNFSIKPLRLAMIFGLIAAIIGFIYGIVIIIQKISGIGIIQGYSSTMVVLLLMGGIIMVLLGIIGEYLGRIFVCINNAPQYVIKERRNLD